MNLRKNLGGAFDMAVNYSEDNPYYRQEESENDDGTKDVLMYSMKQVSPEMVANIRNITGVKYCDASTENLYDGLLPIPGTVPVEEEFSHCVTGVGVWRSSEQEFFTSEKLTLIAGRHIAENDTHSAIISDVLAEKNQIKLGDTFTITGGSKKEISLEVIGLFHANVTEKLGAAVTSYDKIQNHIFTDSDFSWPGRSVAALLHRVFYYRCFRNGFFGQRYALETERYSKPHELKKGGKSNVNFGL